jgi:uncharacterized protein YnzC (UPF0291/DUF896 family)
MKAFIHISDLHITEKNRPGVNELNERTKKTWLVAQDDSKNDDYIREFCNSVKDQFGDANLDFYLLISGDIADSSSETEYNFAKEYLEQIRKELKIDKKQILIVPGNHDVYWPKCRSAADDNPDLQAYQHFEAKYSNFKRFFDGFYEGTGKTFGVNRQIVDYLALDDERILFVGINTNYKISYVGGKGSVEIDALNEELTALCNSYSDYSKIALFHHNMISDSEYDHSPYGSWDKNDWINFKRVLEGKEFKVLLFGNEHVKASSHNMSLHREESEMYLSDSGCFAVRDNPCAPSYKVYELVQESNKTSLKQHIFGLEKEGDTGVRSYGSWCRKGNKDHKEFDEFVLLEVKPNPFNQKIKEKIPTKSSRKASGTTDVPKEVDGKRINSNLFIDYEHMSENDFRNKIMSIIKSEHLYHPGHFHWGKSSRSHNWIDTMSLLNKRHHIRLIQGKIRSLVREIEETRDIEFDAIIGIGMEGNIMSTQLLLEDIPYAYLPYTYRYEEFNDFEKCVCLDNIDGRYKNVMIITDVVNKGRMLRSLIEEREAAFFANVVQIHVVSLFFTGQIKKENAEKDNDEQKEMPIIPDGLKEIKDKTIEFYPLIRLEVGVCPYDDTFKDSCTIYKEHLCEIYEFYSEK